MRCCRCGGDEPDDADEKYTKDGKQVCIWCAAGYTEETRRQTVERIRNSVLNVSGLGVPEDILTGTEQGDFVSNLPVMNSWEWGDDE